jgi:hypothetical protein
MMSVLAATPAELVRTVTAAALAAFDFREPSPYGNDRHTRHRPRLAWFVDLVDMFGRVPQACVRKLPTAEGTIRHLSNAVRAIRTIAAASGKTLEQAVALLGPAAQHEAQRRAGTGLDSLLFRLRHQGMLA